jgi:hypothetical protein
MTEMPPHWHGPEDAVKQAAASAALEGHEIDPEWQKVLHKVATVELSADAVILRERLVAAIRTTSEPPWPSDGADDVADALLPVVTSWDWLMAVLAVHYPPDVFVGGEGSDPGPQIVALTREVEALDEADRAAERAAWDRAQEVVAAMKPREVNGG